MNKEIETAIDNFINKTIVMQGYDVMLTVQQEDRKFVKDFLLKFYPAFETLFKNKKQAQQIFVRRLPQIDIVGLNSKFADNKYLKDAYSKLKNEKTKKYEGGLFGFDGQLVFLINLDFNKYSKEEFLQTLVHEFVHAMSAKKFTIKDKNGINQYLSVGVKTYDNNYKALGHFNEGLTEIVAKDLYLKMFNQSVKSADRYQYLQYAFNTVLNFIGKRSNLIEEFLIDGRSIIARLKSQKNIQGESLFDFIISLDKSALQEMKNNNSLLEKIETYKYCENKQNLI